MSDKKPRGRPFQKGNKISKGAPQLTSDERHTRQMNALEFMRIANKYLYCSVAELVDLAQDTSLPVIEGIVIKVLMLAGQSGDERKLEFVLNRIMGKPKEFVDVTSSDGSMSGQAKVVITLPENFRSKKS